MKLSNRLMTAFTGACLAAFIGIPAQAQEGRAIVTTDLNMRQGPSVNYRVIGTIPGGTTVPVFGCVSGYNWCEVGYRGQRGWSSARYLRDVRPRYRDDPLAEIGPQIGLRILDFVIGQIDEGRDRDGEPPRRGRPGPGEVCFFEHYNYDGDRFCARIGQSGRSMPGNWNDRVSSIRVGPGAGVRVCEHAGYGGRCEVYDSNVPRLTGGQNDRISSFQVRRRGAGGGDDRPQASICFYEHVDFGGARFCASPGQSDNALRGDWNDRISSIRASGGATAQVCEHYGFAGQCTRIDRDVRRLSGSWNDAISSYRVR